MQRRNRKIAATMTGVIPAVVLLRGCVATSYSILSSDMENSLYRDEHILANKWSHGLRLPFMGLWGYYRWVEEPVHKENVLVFNNPANLLQATIDRKEVFISRRLGVPGDMLSVDSLSSVIPSEKNVPDQKFLYTYPQKKEKQLDSLLTIPSIRPNALLGQDAVNNVRSFNRYEYYLLEQALGNNNWIKPIDKEDSVEALKPLIIPGKGKAVCAYPWNVTLLRNTLVLCERKWAETKNDTLYIEGKPAQHCYFTKGYHWVGASNSINLSDSRLFGLIPKDRVTGKATVIRFSKEQRTGLFGGHRWNRMWKEVKQCRFLKPMIL